MGTSVRYNSLEEANTALLNYAAQLDDPITSYIQEVDKNIGENVTAWAGTAAAEVLPLPRQLHVYVTRIQTSCKTYGERIGKASTTYQASDANAVKTVYDTMDV
jgi:hypothetical protein